MMNKAAINSLGFLLLITGCGGGSDGEPGGNIVGTNEVGQYIQSLPTWREFSPPVPEFDGPSGGTIVQDDEVLDVTLVEDDGTETLNEDIVYACNTTPYTLSSNPQEMVVFQPDRDVLYPGALIQGRSHADGLGSLLSLQIDEREPVDISIPALPTGTNFRTVAPTQALVESAIGEMVGNATQDELSTPSSTFFKLEEFYSERQFAASAGISGNYLNYSGSASGSIDRDSSESSLSLLYVERMFNVVYSAPNLPERFFTDDLTPDVLQRYRDAGLIGPDNLPVYVSSVVYGRMLMFTITSTASSEELRATMQAAYDGGINNVEANLSAKQKTILQNSEIRISSWGGDSMNVADVIRSGDWSAYFAQKPVLSTAEPLSYTLKNLGDQSTAVVGETTEYSIENCQARGTAGETFSFRTRQDLVLPVPTPASVHKGDFNGDNSQDLAWVHLDGTSNTHAVGISNGNGTFDIKPSVSHPDTAVESTWGGYSAHVGDFDNDGLDDLAFVHHDFYNIVFFAYSNGDGTFRYSSEQRMQQTQGWAVYEVLVGNFDGVNGDDIVFNATSASSNNVHLRVTAPDGSLSSDTRLQQYGGVGWQDYSVQVANVDADGDDDLIWIALRDDQNAVHVGRFFGSENGSLFTSGNLSIRRGLGNNWIGYQSAIGDIDGIMGADIAFVNTDVTADYIPVHRNISTGDGLYDMTSPFQSLTRVDQFNGRFELYLADVNGDGRSDLVMDKRDTLNRLIVGLGRQDGSFELESRSPQVAPDTDDWSLYELLFLDVDNDGDEDLVYLNNGSALKIHVGLAR